MADVDEDTDATGRKRQVATHSLLDAAGKVVDEMELAEGVRYVDDATGKTKDAMWADLPEWSRKWYAFFGIKTLWTNEASQVRQAAKKASLPPDGAEQMAAIDARHAMITNPERDKAKFVDRSREAMVWEADTLIQAGVNVMAANGDIDDTDATRAAYTKSLTDKMAVAPDQWTKTLRGIEGVENEYRRLKGGAVKKSSAALAAALATTEPAK